MNVLICDDSSMIHRIIERVLQDEMNLCLYHCYSGQEALDVLNKKQIHVLLLDLSMPIVDGYEVLARLSINNRPNVLAILSANVQKQAQSRCHYLGATHFLPKPFSSSQLRHFFKTVNLCQTAPIETPSPVFLASDQERLQAFTELTNVALAKGAAIIANHLGSFIKIPIPCVGMMESADLEMTLTDCWKRDHLVSVTQRFVGSGIHGEALVHLRGEDLLSFGHRLGFSSAESTDKSVFSGIANLLVSSFLRALSELLSISLIVRPPVVLEDYMASSGISLQFTSDLLSIEYNYCSEEFDFECDVLFLMDKASMRVIYQLIATLDM